MGAPGTGLSRREFLKATGVAGLSASAGCTAPSAEQPAANTQTTRSTAEGDLHDHVPPEVVNVDEQGGK